MVVFVLVITKRVLNIKALIDNDDILVVVKLVPIKGMENNITFTVGGNPMSR